ncbi:MAG: glycosyltransferase [Cyclobacteriaceae bacterium]|nr:glycosyltransferase [Cyclobacteriaceae bacterium]
MASETNYLFYFYRYVQPVWYFNLRVPHTIPYWINYNALDAEHKKLIDFDGEYQSTAATLRDAAYQAWHKGIVIQDVTKALPADVDRLPIVDEYRFIRKYFNPIWSIYVLLIRIITFNNPLREFWSFFTTIGVSRVNVFVNHSTHEAWNDFHSSLLKSAPTVSVIIPTLNRYTYLHDVLVDLENQRYRNFEVIVVDQTDPFQANFYEGRSLKLNVIQQREKALWLARNTAIEQSEGKYILLFDDDSRVEPDWIEQHLKCIDYFQCEISAGVSLSVVGAKVPENYSYFRWSDQLDTGNVMLKREVFEKIGLFDRQFEKQRMGDGEFGLRALLAGYKNISNPHARRVHLKVESGGLRQMGSWDGYRPTRFFAPRPVPSVLYLIRRYFGRETAMLDITMKVPPSFMPFRFKRNPILLLVASMFSIFLAPVIVLAIAKSWELSSRMIKKGPLIKLLSRA